MASPSKLEVIKQAIKEVIEEMGGGSATKSSSSSSSDDDGNGGDDNHHHRLLLSKLMSQLERLEDEPEADTELTKVKSNVSRLEHEDEEEEEERIVKEIKNVKRQNLITHCLLSVMIVLTVAWQISQVSLILKLKDGVAHPFKSIGSIFKTIIKNPKPNGNANHEDTESSSITSNLIESSPVHDLKIPEFPHVDLPKSDFGFNYKD